MAADRVLAVSRQLYSGFAGVHIEHKCICAISYEGFFAAHKLQPEGLMLLLGLVLISVAIAAAGRLQRRHVAPGRRSSADRDHT